MVDIPTTNQTSPTALQPGSIKIEEISLKSGTRSPVSISNIIQEFNIYENIFQEFVAINILILDTSSLFTLFPLTGDETLTVSFSTPDPAFKKPFKMTFRVVSITDLAQTQEVRVVQYRLRAVAPEAFNDWTKRVRKSFPGGNQNSSPIKDMVEKIFNDFLKSGNATLKASTTDGQHCYVIPNLRPSDAIKFLCREAKSNTYPASNFLFFSNADGYFFKTFDELIAAPDPSIPVDRYLLTPKQYSNENIAAHNVDLDVTDISGISNSTPTGQQLPNDKPSEFRKVIQYSYKRIFDIEKKIQMGGFDNTLFYLDINKSTYEVSKFNYKKDYEKLKWIDQGKVVNSTSSPLLNLQGDSHHRFIHVAKDNDNVNIDQKHEFLHYQTASAAMMDYVMCEVVIPGDAGRRVGDHIELVMPEYSRFEETKSLESLLISGVYTITALRHTFNPGVGGFTTQMQCVKNSFRNNPEKGETISGSPQTSTEPEAAGP